MKRVLGILLVTMLVASAAIAAGPKDYQVTGPVLDVNDDGPRVSAPALLIQNRLRAAELSASEITKTLAGLAPRQLRKQGHARGHA